MTESCPSWYIIDSFPAALCVNGGVFLETALLLGRHLTLKRLLILAAVLFGPLLTVFYVLMCRDMTDGWNWMLTWLTLYVVVAAMLLKDQILPRIGPGSVILFSLFFWYTWLKSFNPGFVTWMLLVLGVTGTFIVALLIRNIRQKTTGSPTWMKAATYGWYLVMLVCLIMFNLGSGGLDILRPYEIRTAPHNPFYLVLDSMVLFFLAVHLVHLLQLIPIPSRDMPWHKTVAFWRENVHFAAQRLDEESVDRFGWTVWFVAPALLILGNELVNLVQPLAMINFLMILLTSLDRRQQTRI